MKTKHERFMQKIKIDADTGCWEWQASKSSTGYGQFRVGDKNWKSHRWSYQYHRGEIPDRMCVCHKCDNPLCSNPDHLFLGTKQENMDDMITKGRAAHGEKHPSSKLNYEKVLLIRKFLDRHPPTNSKTKGGQYGFLARWFETTANNISLIYLGRRWKHIK